MINLKQRLSDMRDELASDKGYEHIGTCDEMSDAEIFKDGFDILAPQIIELVEALNKIESEVDRFEQYAGIAEVSRDQIGDLYFIIHEALEKFNKFLGDSK